MGDWVPPLTLTHMHGPSTNNRLLGTTDMTLATTGLHGATASVAITKCVNDAWGRRAPHAITKLVDRRGEYAHYTHHVLNLQSQCSHAQYTFLVARHIAKF